VDKARVDEVRASNVALTSQLAEEKRRFEGIESEQVKAIAAERDGLNARLTAIQVDQGVLTVATKKGLRPSAIPDITARARTVFKLVQGTPGRSFIPDGHSLPALNFFQLFFNLSVNGHVLSTYTGEDKNKIRTNQNGYEKLPFLLVLFVTIC
jgi:hypothetical protein